MPYISTCRSPMQMFVPVIKEEYSTSSRRIVHVAVMPCTAKKFEAARKEFKVGGVPRTDYVLTTQELINMIKESGIIFNELEPEAVDMTFGRISGTGVIFGVTGGVTEAVLRRISSDKSTGLLKTLVLCGVRHLESVKEATVSYENKALKIAGVSGLDNDVYYYRAFEKGRAL